MADMEDETEDKEAVRISLNFMTEVERFNDEVEETFADDILIYPKQLYKKVCLCNFCLSINTNMTNVIFSIKKKTSLKDVFYLNESLWNVFFDIMLPFFYSFCRCALNYDSDDPYCFFGQKTGGKTSTATDAILCRQDGF